MGLLGRSEGMKLHFYIAEGGLIWMLQNGLLMVDNIWIDEFHDIYFMYFYNSSLLGSELSLKIMVINMSLQGMLSKVGIMRF